MESGETPAEEELKKIIRRHPGVLEELSEAQRRMAARILGEEPQ